MIAAAVAAVLLTAAGSGAQGLSTYEGLVNQYAAGDAAAAVSTLVTWPMTTVTTDAANRSRLLPPARQRAAVMLHTDAAYVCLTVNRTADAATHVSIARRILGTLRATSLRDERAQMFEARWYAFVASMYTALGQLTQADLIVRDGLGLYARDARLHVARGSIREMNVAMTYVEQSSGKEIARASRELDAAAADFRRAIGYDATLAVAHLHLGWVRFLGRDDRSLHDFEAALEHASHERTRYLAHLFLGAFAERHDRLEDARREYEAALGIGPGWQSGFVALSRVEEALGHSARAQELARDYAARPAKPEDPWWDYHLGGFDQETLEWLRREAMIP